MNLTPSTHAVEHIAGRHWHVYLNGIDVTFLCFLADTETGEIGMYEIAEDGSFLTEDDFDRSFEPDDVTALGDLHYKYSPRRLCRFRKTKQDVRIQLGEREYPPVSYADYLKAIAEPEA